ncbi:MAG: hypothetical protein NVSMB7_11550 [Chitinophagaceae bacterium]
MGNGYVDIFNTAGSVVKRFAAKESLNSPWDVAQAPASFFADADNDRDDKNNNSGHGKSETSSGISRGSDDENTILGQIIMKKE